MNLSRRGILQGPLNKALNSVLLDTYRSKYYMM